jgi:hypothetical protein
MAKIDIDNFSLAGTKIVGSSFTADECNAIIKFLLAVKTYKGSYNQNQDLNEADTPTFASVILTNASTGGIVGTIFPIINGSTNEIEFKTADQYRIALGIPKIKAGIADVFSGLTVVTLAENMPAGSIYVFSGIVYGSNGEVSFATAPTANLAVDKFTCESSIAGKLYYTLTQIL